MTTATKMSDPTRPQGSPPAPDRRTGRRGFLAGIASLAAAGAASPLLTGCSTEASAATVTPEVWALTDPVQNAIQTKYLEPGTPRRRLAVFPNTNYTQKLRIAMGTSKGPDVFFNWGGASVGPYDDAGMVVDLAEHLPRGWAEKAFLPASLGSARTGDGKLLGLPLKGMQPVVLFYNKDMFDDLGLAAPDTWDSFLRAVDRVKKENVTPIALAGAESWTQLMWFEFLAERLGRGKQIDALFRGTRGSWRDGPVEESLKYVRDLVERGAFGRTFGSVSYGSGTATALFATGRAAMHLMGTWEYTNLNANHKKFAARSLAWSSFPQMPSGAGGAGALVGNPTNYFSVSSRSNLAADHIKMLKDRLNSRGYVDTLIAAGEVPAAAGIEDRLEAKSPDPRFSRWVYDTVAGAERFTLSWDQALQPVLKEAMLAQLQEVFLGTTSPSSFVDTMEALL
ncbi:extracellular solute-binding protein [Streptomyces endophyticus]|uniref:Extracellular solute-binding protein n=1 Tax=Streptomyces endophyticus TaxID=714166 RepID=A0ABU6F302_9ACTN|nr:extracellular solute-binding protein [Streptomyces endophyticus]MEB8338224.1 extracellular solute-binding protein [Streptomyces endophyticus]